MTEAQTDDWYLAGNVADFEDEDIEQLKVGNLAVAVYFAEGNFYATQDLCTHERAYLSDGILIDCIVECPFHQGRFDVRNGKAMSAPAFVALKTNQLKIVDGKKYVNLPSADDEAYH